MLSRAFIRDNLADVGERLRTKGFVFEGERFLEVDEEERAARIEWEELRALRNRTSDQIAEFRKSGRDASGPIAEMKRVSSGIKELDERVRELQEGMSALLVVVPNLPHGTVPIGTDESSNEVVKEVGNPADFDFEVKDHVELGTNLGILDPERGSKIAGARFTNYYGAGALLERALANFMLDVHTQEHGYLEILPPFMANRKSFFGTGNLPKFESDLFRVEGTDYFLVPTAEVPVTNVFADETLGEEDLPISFVAFTPCFRSEAGSYGKDTKGLIRQHQFNKVELVKFSKPSDSYQQLEQLTLHAQEILNRLEVPYRIVTLCSGDMSFSSAKTYDLEAWIPSQNRYREISSCTNFEDFQARRANIRFKSNSGKGSRFVHTLNGSGLAVGRTWVAIVENFQQADGTIAIPEALRPYLRGMKQISKETFMLT